MKRKGGLQILADVPRGGKDVVILPEVVRSLRPVGVVIQSVAGGLVGFRIHRFIKRVELPQTYAVHVGVSLDTGILAVGAVHYGKIVGAGGNAVPSLAGMLIVADVPVADDEVPSDPVQPCVPRAGFPCGAVDIAVSAGCVECGVGHKMIAEQPCGHREAGVVRVVAAVGGVQFHERIVGRSLCTKSDRAAERAVTVG